MKKQFITLAFSGLAWLGSSAQYPNHIIIEKLLKTDTTSAGQKITYPKFENAEITALKIMLKPGSSTGWHKHDIPLFAYIVQGTLTVETDDGKQLQFEAGSAMSEVIGMYHQGINRGKEELILIAFYLGGKGIPLLIAKEIPEKTKN